MKKRNVYTILKFLNEVLVLFSCGLGDQYSIDAINFIIAKQDSTKPSIFINKRKSHQHNVYERFNRYVGANKDLCTNFNQTVIV